MTDWQPIETAPKDGTVILIFRDGVHYIREGSRTVHPARWMGELDPAYPWQVLCADYGADYLPAARSITHWMPMPEPPKEEDNSCMNSVFNSL